MGSYRSVCLLLGALPLASSFAPLTPTRVTSPIATTGSSTQLMAFPEIKHGETIPKFVATGMIALSTVFGPLQMADSSSSSIYHPAIPVANAAESRILGELKGSGLVFKVRPSLSPFLLEILLYFVKWCMIPLTSLFSLGLFQNC